MPPTILPRDPCQTVPVDYTDEQMETFVSPIEKPNAPQQNLDTTSVLAPPDPQTDIECASPSTAEPPAELTEPFTPDDSLTHEPPPSPLQTLGRPQRICRRPAYLEDYVCG